MATDNTALRVQILIVVVQRHGNGALVGDKDSNRLGVYKASSIPLS